MSIKEKAIAKIAAQLSALIGAENFRIVDGEHTFGEYTDTPTKPRKSFQKQFHFKDTEVYPMVKALKAGETVNLRPLPGVPTKNLQAAAAGIAYKAFGAGNSMTSRCEDGGVDVLRLT